ncbi:hypothetical protein KRR55_19995, partial [Paeniglutamicibacter sp. ABSL32-1]|uniref:hypothetical protein n=1 Tax=Paeniglutamicibacter quisquiliarum TaxID=2849498 RepID=UPI001C2CF2DB
TCSEFQNYLGHLSKQGLLAQQKAGTSTLAKYLVSVMDVAFFVYSGSPSVSHSMKLSQIIVGSIRELELAGLSHLELSSYKDKIRRELLAQLMAIRDERSFGLHTLNLLDCLVHMGAHLTSEALDGLLEKRQIGDGDLDAFALLTLIRSCGSRSEAAVFRTRCLRRVESLVKQGKTQPDYETQRAILLLSIPASPDLTNKEVVRATGLTADEVKAMRSSRSASLFAWDSDKHYHERLLLKASRMVY